jgi:hypothetical protein
MNKNKEIFKKYEDFLENFLNLVKKLEKSKRIEIFDAIDEKFCVFCGGLKKDECKCKT